MMSINASLICMNPLHIHKDLTLIYSKGIKKLHFDIMDGNYVGRYGLYPEILKEVVAGFDFEVDCHLMVRDVISAVDEWCKYAVPRKISFHLKGNEGRVTRLVDAIRSYGASPILVIDLDVTAEDTRKVLEYNDVEGLMFMSIKPGVLSQKHRPESTIDKITELNAKGSLEHLKWVQVDGGVSFSTAKQLIGAGANELICGSSTVFKVDDGLEGSLREIRIHENIERLNRLIADV